MKELEPTFSRIESTKSLANDIKLLLEHAEKTNDIETFDGTPHTKAANKYVHSSIRSYQIAYELAELNKKDLELARAQSEFGGKSKIYYNLFTTALWIINIACLIGIFYILIMGFMDFGSAPTSGSDSGDSGISNMIPSYTGIGLLTPATNVEG